MGRRSFSREFKLEALPASRLSYLSVRSPGERQLGFTGADRLSYAMGAGPPRASGPWVEDLRG